MAHVHQVSTTPSLFAFDELTGGYHSSVLAYYGELSSGSAPSSLIPDTVACSVNSLGGVKARSLSDNNAPDILDSIENTQLYASLISVPSSSGSSSPLEVPERVAAAVSAKAQISVNVDYDAALAGVSSEAPARLMGTTQLSFYPQPFVASPTAALDYSNWFVDYAHLTFWFLFFATFVVVLWLVYIFVALSRNAESRRVVRETRGFSRAQTGDALTAVLPLT